MFMKIAGWLLQFWGLFKLVVRIIEEAGDENGWSGEEKLMHAKLLTEWLADHFGLKLPDTLWASLGTVISTVVSVFNLLGIFKHKEDKPADVPAEDGALKPAAIQPAEPAPAKTMEDYQREAEAEFERLSGRKPTVLAQ